MSLLMYSDIIQCVLYLDAYQEQIKQERQHRQAVQQEVDQLKGMLLDLKKFLIPVPKERQCQD